MTAHAFELLAPIVQHHVVNDLGWPALRPVQAECVEPILRGDNLIVNAPTAGGKTEAAFFPLLSRLVSEGWRGLSILYLSPLGALISNQVARLQRYFGWAGLRAEPWYGDVGQGARRRIRASPPECLLTTPESLEGVLCSTLSEPDLMFADLQAVVIDEAHRFAQGDRGWHMLAILERLSAIAGRDLQRIGLSATVGNTTELRAWLSGRSGRAQGTVAPAADPDAPPPEVTIDYVGSEENAAHVIHSLHRGEKRLVFCDSRLQCERLGADLRRRGTQTFVTHSSLSRDQRRQAEGAFTEGRGCVIVSTSALELGIDIGDLDRVIQIDSPGSVSSFLQRMGRTGRRPDTHTNCLFLATDEQDLVRACAVVDRWREGYVEPAQATPYPAHILAQQALALLLQHTAMPADLHREAVRRLASLFGVAAGADALLSHLYAEGYIFRDSGLASIGPTAEAALGRRHFLELLSVFSLPPLYAVQQGRKPIGSVHEASFWPRGADDQTILILAGRTWLLNHLDRRRRIAYVEPFEAPKGRTRWLGRGRPRVRASMAERMRDVLLGGAAHCGRHLSRRAESQLASLVEEHAHLHPDRPTLVDEGMGRYCLWTFAGSLENRAIARRLQVLLPASAIQDDPIRLQLRLGTTQADEGQSDAVVAAWTACASIEPPPIDPAGPLEEKFLELLAPPTAQATLRARQAPADRVRAVLARLPGTVRAGSRQQIGPSL